MSDRLPPLTALRAFEAAARHMSFAKAADELNVTPAALSYQIKALEADLGQPVFRRLNRDTQGFTFCCICPRPSISLRCLLQLVDKCNFAWGGPEGKVGTHLLRHLLLFPGTLQRPGARALQLLADFVGLDEEWAAAASRNEGCRQG